MRTAFIFALLALTFGAVAAEETCLDLANKLQVRCVRREEEEEEEKTRGEKKKRAGECPTPPARWEALPTPSPPFAVQIRH